MKQRVKNISYLAKVDIDVRKLQNNKYEAIALPAGAEVIDVIVKVAEAVEGATTLDVGLQGLHSYSKEAFINDVSVVSIATHRSNEVIATSEASRVVLEFDTKPTSGRLVLRVVYFCPSEILTEF